MDYNNPNITNIKDFSELYQKKKLKLCQLQKLKENLEATISEYIVNIQKKNR